jgi:hypothetical protein
MGRLPIILLLAITGCGTTIGGDAGKCFGGQVQPPSLSLGAPAAPPSGQFTFSAPAGSRFALCAW